jgi:hypothetical protein
MTRKAAWWLATKIAGVVLTSIATYNVFHAAFDQSIRRDIFFIPRSTAVLLGVFVAFVLVDLLYVMLVTFLEEERTPDEPFTARWGQVISLWILYAFIVAIGYADEGLIAFAPRIGLGILALNATLKYVGEWSRWRDETWEDRFVRRRNRRAQDDYVKMLEYERKLRYQSSRKALSQLADHELIADYYARYANDLLDRHTLISDSQPLLASSAGKAYAAEEYVYYDNGWVWEDPFTGEIHRYSQAGKPYSERGARRAFGRYVKKVTAESDSLSSDPTR